MWILGVERFDKEADEFKAARLFDVKIEDADFKLEVVKVSNSIKEFIKDMTNGLLFERVLEELKKNERSADLAGMVEEFLGKEPADIMRTGSYWFHLFYQNQSDEAFVDEHFNNLQAFFDETGKPISSLDKYGVDAPSVNGY